MLKWNQNLNPNNQNQSVDFLADFDSVEAKKPIPDGNYITKVTKWEKGYNHNDKPRVAFTLTIQGSEYAGENLNMDTYWTTDKAKQITKEVCGILGVNPSHPIEDYPPIYVEVKWGKKPNSPFTEVKVLRRLSDEEANQRIIKDSDSSVGIPGAL